MGYDRKKFAPIRCDSCGKEFTPRSSAQRFCCRACSAREWQREKQRRRVAERGAVRCAACGKIFEPHGTQKYCCIRCRQNAENAKRREEYNHAGPKRMTQNMREIARIARQARELGLTYGQAVGRYGGDMDELQRRAERARRRREAKGRLKLKNDEHGTFAGTARF